MTSKPTNIIIITNRASLLGGAEKVACLEAIAASRRGFSVTLFAGSGPISPELERAGVRVICLNQQICSEDPNRLRGFLHGLWNYKAETCLRDCLRGLDPTKTVVHLHSWAHVLSASILKPIRQFGFPLVITAHDYFLVCPNGGLLDYCKMTKCGEQPVSWHCLRCNCDKRSYAQKLYRCLRWTLQRNELSKITNISIATISDIGENLIRERDDVSGLSGSYYYRLPNPLDGYDKTASYTRCEYASDSFYLYVGRMSMEKGPQLLCEASNSLSHKCIFIGDGPLLDEMCQRFPNCVFLGRLSFDEIVPFYGKARALVVPSLCYEGLPLAVCEAKAFGAGAVVTPTDCAATEAAGYADDELTFECGDVASLTSLLQLLDDDRALAKARLKPSAPAPALDIESHLDSLVSLYTEALAST